LRQLSAVLLRRLIFSSFDDIVKSGSHIIVEQMKTELLLLMRKDITIALRRKVCDITAELAKNCIGIDITLFLLQIIV
jgi:hypothetical protein